jgi:hypothetical protein
MCEGSRCVVMRGVSVRCKGFRDEGEGLWQGDEYPGDKSSSVYIPHQVAPSNPAPPKYILYIRYSYVL